MTQFIVSESSNGQLYFRLRGNNGEIILKSEGYSSKAGVDSGIESIKRNAKFESSYVRYDNPGAYSFLIKANNGQIIAFSERYVTREARERTIEELKRIAENAEFVRGVTRVS